MNIVQSDFGPVCMGVISGEFSRYDDFHICREMVLLPPFSNFKWQRGGGYAAQRNIIVREMLDDPANFQWLWFIDDDHTFAPDIVLKLLRRNVPVIQPLVCTRKPPFLPYAYRWDGERYRTVDWPGLMVNCIDGLRTVDASACGGMLVKREVLEAVPEPWFKEGQTGDGPGEDFYFSLQARKAGFQGYVDTEVRMGHAATIFLWPHPNPMRNIGDPEDAWNIMAKFDHGVSGILPGNFGRDYLARKHGVSLEDYQRLIRGEANGEHGSRTSAG